MSGKPDIAISSCILGHAVRYDGATKYLPDICQQLQQHCNLIAVCPEVEIGLGVPRPPVQLSGDPRHPDMTGRDDARINVTSRMRAYCHTKPAQLDRICGYVFKSKSPSCGLRNIPVFQQGSIVEPDHAGLFAEAMMQHYPALPVTDELALAEDAQRRQFIAQVLHYYQQRQRNELK